MRYLSALFLGILLAGCADPAVRLANCVERGKKELGSSARESVTCQCDLKLDGRYTAVLYPALAVSDAQLAAHGLTPEAIRAVRALQFPGPPYESIYVVSLDRSGERTRTTYHANFAKIAELSTVTKDAPAVTFELKKDGAVVVIENLR